MIRKARLRRKTEGERETREGDTEKDIDVDESRRMERGDFNMMNYNE